MSKPHEAMGDKEFIRHAADVGVEGIIAEREARGRQLASRFADLRGLPFEAFLERLAEQGHWFDFITASTLYETLNPEATDA